MKRRYFFPVFLSMFLGVVAFGQKPAGAGAPKQDPATSAAPRQDSAPLAALALSDADKVRLLKLVGEQKDRQIEKQKNLLRNNDIDKEIADLQGQIQKIASDLAAAGKIDPGKYVLDLDKLVWLSKELK